MTDAPVTNKRRWGRRILFLVLLLAIIIASTVLWLNSVANSRLEVELAYVRDAGAPLRLIELAPLPVPAADNAAPLLLEAFELVVEEPEAWYEDARFERYEVDPFGQEDAWYEELSAWVERNAPALEKARAAAARTACQFDLDWEKGLGAESPQIWGLLTLSRVRGAQAILTAREGRLDAAVAICADMVRLADIAMQDPLMIYGLMRAALVDIALETAQRVLARGPTTSAVLENLLARLAELPRQDELQKMFVGERAFGYSAFSMVREDPSTIDIWTPFDEGFGIGRGVLYRLIPDTMIKLDSAHYMQLMRRTIELAQRPYRDARADWATLSAEMADRPWYAVLSAATGASFPLVARKWTSHEARVDVARLGLHLELYVREHGALPATFADLPVRLPVDDPFRASPYVLKTTGDGGFVVYSVGPDARDDGGVPLDDDEQGDLVWQQPAYP